MTHILIVDDSETERGFLQHVLEKNGFKTTCVGTAEDGLVKAQELKPDLILMDVLLPGMSGFHATRKLTHDTETEHIPVIIVSGKTQQSDQAWGERQGACEYLTKPVTDDVLLAAVRRHLPEGASRSATRPHDREQ
ncbi:MAG: response regulator [Gammaproteobacteria bacterium]|nr:MAG: response regulator [Gammaproteobacteria bacterium]